MRKTIVKIFCLCLLPAGISISAQNKFKIGLDAGYTYSVMHGNLSNLKIPNIKQVTDMGLIYQGNTGYGKQFLYRQEFPICKRITILREQGRLVGGIVIIPITF